MPVVDSRRNVVKKLQQKRLEPVVELGADLLESDPKWKFYKLLKEICDVEQDERQAGLVKMTKWLRKNFSILSTKKDMRRVWTAILRSFWLVDGRAARFQMVDDICAILIPSESLEKTIIEGAKDEKARDEAIEGLSRWWGAMFVCMQRQWEKLDEWRVDKYLLLLRNQWEHMMKKLDEMNWCPKLISSLCVTFTQTGPFSTQPSTGRLSMADGQTQLQILTYYTENFQIYLIAEGKSEKERHRIVNAIRKFNNMLADYCKHVTTTAACRKMFNTELLPEIKRILKDNGY